MSKTTYKTGGMDQEEASKFYEDAAGSDLSTTYTSWGTIWGVSAKRCLRVLYGKDVLLAIGPDAMGMVNADNGKSAWVSKWDYDNEEVQYIPKVIANNLIFCSQENLTLLNLSTGKQIWQVEESEKSKFFESPQSDFFFSINDEKIKEYTLANNKN